MIDVAVTIIYCTIALIAGVAAIMAIMAIPIIANWIRPWE